MRLVQITDMHIYADPAARFGGVDTRASLEQVLAAAAGVRDCDLALLSGDLSMDGSASSYAWLAPRVAGLASAVVAIPGNHDEPAAWPAGSGGFAPTPSTLEHGAWRIHLLDTRVPGRPHGRLGATALAWLTGALAATTDVQHALVMHHPPLATGARWIDAMGLEDAAALWQLIESAGRVRLIVSGHVHRNLDTWRGATRVLTTPSTCVQFAPNSDAYATDRRGPGFRVIELADDGRVDTRVVRV